MVYKTVFLCAITMCFFLTCQESSKNETITTINQEAVIDDEKMLLGPINLMGLQLADYNTWFDSVYYEYAPQESTLNKLKEQLTGIEIKSFIGTWCSDSQRDLPALYRILDDLKYNIEKMQVVAVNRDKDQPADLLYGFNIEFVPTFIFYRNKVEIGRVVEIPDKTLEEDMLSILSK